MDAEDQIFRGTKLITNIKNKDEKPRIDVKLSKNTI